MDKAKVKRILVISLSNIGDVVLTTPVIQALRENFPRAHLAVLVGPRAFSVFKSDRRIDKKIIYDKSICWRNKLGLVNRLKADRYDLVVDLRQTLFGVFLGARYRSSLFARPPKSLVHMKDRHLWKLKSLGLDIDHTAGPSVMFSEDDQNHIGRMFAKWQVKDGQAIVAMAPGARNMTKRWEKEGYRQLAGRLTKEYNARIIMVGDRQDELLAQEIISRIEPAPLNAAGKTSIGQLAFLLTKCRLLVSSDSAPMHLGWAVNTPVVAIFGPTSHEKYGPGGPDDIVLRRDITCSPCEQSLCPGGTRRCMKLISAEDVFQACKKILRGSTSMDYRGLPRLSLNKKILITRTDRIGDVLLSTPAIKALRKSFPQSHVALMVRPYARDIALGNPYLDEVIIYDKYRAQRSFWKSMAFAWGLRKKRFDLALILHPTNRMHLVSALAGIKRRVGFNRKLGFLLTDKIEHQKQQGQKHELEYTLDVLRTLGFEPEDKDLFMPIRKDSEMYIEELLSRETAGRACGKMVALHPGASCPSKIWPAERFAQVADKLAGEFKVRVVVVAGPDDVDKGKKLISLMRCGCIDACGRTTLSQLASLLRRCCLFISNDSGPVHIAAAVGVPVVAIFGRGQPGLSPRRWGPTGKDDIVLHKDVGCRECLAHNCRKGFACLRAISAQEVLAAARKLLDTYSIDSS